MGVGRRGLLWRCWSEFLSFVGSLLCFALVLLFVYFVQFIDKFSALVWILYQTFSIFSSNITPFHCQLSTILFHRRGHEGLRMGPRHIPLSAAFMNGTVEGEDVWIPMTSILGGQERCGFGWNMFVECLAEGRGVSLPAGSIGAARSVIAGVGAYSRVRKQFRVPIAEFGGIQEGELVYRL